MIRILLFWLVEFLLFVGVGAGLQRLLLKRAAFGLFDTFWIGLMAVIGILQWMHLVVPIAGTSLIIFVVAGLVGLVFSPYGPGSALENWRRGDEDDRRRRRVAAALIVFVACVCAARSAWLKLPTNGDTALYHWNIVRWANEYPAVPGIANLHDRLGFNSSYLLWAALIDNFWADRRAAALMPGFLLVVVSAQWLHSIILDRRRHMLPARIYALLSFPFLVRLMWMLNPALYYDNAQMFATLVLFRSVLAWHCEQKKAGDSAEQASLTHWCVFWLGLAGLAFTFKLSGALVLLLTTLLVIWLLSNETPKAWLRAAWWGKLVRVGALPALLVLGYFARSAILSGWLMYPAPTLNLHLPWSVPEASVRELYEVYIRDWARMPGVEGLETVKKGFWAWFPKWHQIFRRGTAHAALVMGVVGAAAFVLRQRRKGESPMDRMLPVLMMAGAMMNILFWFTGAPDMRFGEGLFWCWMALCLAFALCACLRSQRLVWAVALGVATYMVIDIQSDPIPTDPFSLLDVARSPKSAAVLMTVPNGQQPPLQVYISPDKEDQAPGDSPLPAALGLDPNLMMREPGNIRAGFYERPGAVLTH